MQLNDSQIKQVGIPDWMLGTDNIDLKKAGRAHTSFLSKTLKEVYGVLQNDLLAERFASKQGFFQGIDPRVKLGSVLLFMIIAGAAKSFVTLVILFVVALALVKLSYLGVAAYIKRVWFILPLLLLILSLPAATNLVMQGRPLVYLYRGLEAKLLFIRLPQELYLSLEGLKSVVKMSLRVGVSISFGYILVMTTRWSHLTKSLAVLRVPGLVTALLDMTYRYIFVLSKLSIEMFEARKLRTVGKISNRDNRKFISGSIAFLFIKANYISEEIYGSMLCRGYTGEPVSLMEFRLSRNDFVWACNMAIILVILAIL